MGLSRWNPWYWVKRIASSFISQSHKLTRAFVRQWQLHPSRTLVSVVVTLVVVGSLSAAIYVGHRNDVRATKMGQYETITAKQLQQDIDQDHIKSLTNASVISGGLLGEQYKFYVLATLKDGHQVVMEQIDPSRQDQWKKLTEEAQKHGFVINQGFNAFEQVPVMGFVNLAVTMLLFLGVFIGAQMLIGDLISGFKFHPETPEHIKMDDIIGYDPAKEEFRQVLHQLKHLDDYEAQGINPPRGILLTGDPGVGKTMLARAVAAHMKAKFFTCTGADFVEMYVGVGPKRVRALFKEARRQKNSVIFIDEIDALGSRDSMGMDSERQTTINRMLAELDGINRNGNLLVIGATNYPDRLDKALRRPGRFDKIIHMPLPDVATREGILRKYLEQLTIDSSVDIPAMALRTSGYSGAQLRQIVDEAKQLALKERYGALADPRALMKKDEDGLVLTRAHLEEGQEIALMGIFTQESEGPEAERAALHELGHALVGHTFAPSTYVEKVTLKGRGDALAYMSSRQTQEYKLYTQEQLKAQMAVLMGGRAAEEVMLGSVSSGASNDLARATAIAENMVTRLGMGQRTGLRTLNMPQTGTWPDTVEQDIQDYLEQAYQRAKDIVESHREWMTSMGRRLIKEKILTHEVLFESVEKAEAKLHHW